MTVGKAAISLEVVKTGPQLLWPGNHHQLNHDSFDNVSFFRAITVHADSKKVMYFA